MTSTIGQDEVVDAARAPAPGAVASLVRNHWYVVAGVEEFDRTPKQRLILGEPVCFYSALDGSPVVLDDRCAHRRFPLSRSKLDGDTIVCGYHGFIYGNDGKCVRVPGGGNFRTIKVRSYPAVQRAPWVWIWTGDEPASADPALIPWPEVAERTDDQVTGYAMNPANYSMIHENLLDLPHFEFLHGVVAGFTESRPQLLSDALLPVGFTDTAIGIRHGFDAEFGVWGVASDSDPTIKVSRTETIISPTPALCYGIGEFTPHDPTATALRTYAVLHCLTPAAESRTHQFWTWWQDVTIAPGHEEWARFMSELFKQDVDAVRWVHEYATADRRSGNVERSSAADAAGLKMRRKLQELAAAEA